MSTPPEHNPEPAEAAITFITGYPRSGTTLLANQLNRLRGIVVGPETQYFRSAYKKLRGATTGRQFLEIVRQDRRLRDFGLSDADLHDAARDSGFQRDRFLQAFLRRHAALAGLDRPAVLLEKSPEHILHAQRALACHPRARFIYLVKDPRDVVTSNLRVNWTHSNVPKHCASWNMCNDAFMDLRRQHPDRVHLVRFEDLVTEPAFQLEGVCRFLGIPCVSDPGKAASAVPEWEAGWKAESMGEVDPGKAYKWQRDDRAAQHRLVSAMTRHYRAVFHYDREPEGTGPRITPRAWAYNSPAYKSLLRFRRVYL